METVDIRKDRRTPVRPVKRRKNGGRDQYWMDGYGFGLATPEPEDNAQDETTGAAALVMGDRDSSDCADQPEVGLLSVGKLIADNKHLLELVSALEGERKRLMEERDAGRAEADSLRVVVSSLEDRVVELEGDLKVAQANQGYSDGMGRSDCCCSHEDWNEELVRENEELQNQLTLSAAVLETAQESARRRVELAKRYNSTFAHALDGINTQNRQLANLCDNLELEARYLKRKLEGNDTKKYVPRPIPAFKEMMDNLDQFIVTEDVDFDAPYTKADMFTTKSAKDVKPQGAFLRERWSPIYLIGVKKLRFHRIRQALRSTGVRTTKVFLLTWRGNDTIELMVAQSCAHKIQLILSNSIHSRHWIPLLVDPKRKIAVATAMKPLKCMHGTEEIEVLI